MCGLLKEGFVREIKWSSIVRIKSSVCGTICETTQNCWQNKRTSWTNVLDSVEIHLLIFFTE